MNALYPVKSDPESKTTTGIFLRAFSIDVVSAVLSTGATTSAFTPRLIMSPMMRSCVLISFSSGGPSHLIATPSSLPARSAPALTDFQKTWVVPLGTTPIVTPPDDDPLLSHAIAQSSSVAQ